MGEWEVEYTNEFEEWWKTLGEAEHKRVAYSVNLLRKFGPSLKFPHTSNVKREIQEENNG